MLQMLHSFRNLFLCTLKSGSKYVAVIGAILLLLCVQNATAQMQVTYPSELQLFTAGSQISPIIPTRSGISGYAYKAVSGRLDVSPDFMSSPTGITSGQDGKMYVACIPGNGVIKQFSPTGMLPTVDPINDPKTGSYTNLGSGFTVPLSLATDGKYIYVADQYAGVRRIVIATKVASAYGTGFSQPISIALNRKGEVYVGQYNGIIKKISADGTTITDFGLDIEFELPVGMAVDPAGNLFISDVMTSKIVKLSPQGIVLETFTGFEELAGLASDNAGNLLIADKNNLKLLPAGSVSSTVASTLASRQITTRYMGVAVDAQGIIYGTDNVVSNLTYLIPRGGFFITPALPPGLNFDYNSGTITGTALTGSPETEYTIYGYDANSNQVKGTLKLKVLSGNADLASLGISAGTLSPNFDPTVLSYSTSVSNSSITLTPFLSDPSASVTVNGVATISGTTSAPVVLNPGLNDILVIVTASDGTVKEYSVKVTQTIALAGLTINSGTLSPTFSPNIAAYTAIIQPNVATVNVTPVANHVSHTVNVNGTAIAAGSPAAIILQDGANQIEIEVVSADGADRKVYNLTLTKLLAQTIDFPALGTKATGIEDFSPATSSSGLPITYSSSSTNVASIVSGKIRLLRTGSVTITARQAGNSQYAAATAVSQTMTIVKGAGVITFNALADKKVGDANFAPGASTTNFTTSTPITYSSSNTAVATISGSGTNQRINIIGAGTTNITASQAGSTYFNASTSVVQPLDVNKGAVTISLTNLEHTYDGSAKSASYTSSVSGLTGLSLTYDGSATAPTQAGSYEVLATLNNANYDTEPIRGTLVIAKAIAQVVLGNLVQTYDGTAKEATAVTTPADLASLSFTYDGVAVAPSSGGSYTVVANLYHTNYTGSTTGTLTIERAVQSITFPLLSTKYTDSPDFEPQAQTNSGLVLTYTSSNPLVAETYQDAADGQKWKIRMIGFGDTEITASQIGNQNYLPATLTRSLHVTIPTLPVSIISFEASLGNANSVAISWQTASEENNNEFQLFRSGSDGIFAYLGKVVGAGNSVVTKRYGFIDKLPLAGINYYRLVQVDYNGNQSIVGERSVHFTLKAKEAVKVYPNPVSDRATIEFAEGKYSQLDLLDTYGRLLERRSIGKRDNHVELSMARYPRGSYLIHLRGGEDIVTKLIKL